MNSNQSCKHYILSGRYTKIASVKKHGQYNDVPQKILLYRKLRRRKVGKRSNIKDFTHLFLAAL